MEGLRVFTPEEMAQGGAGQTDASQTDFVITNMKQALEGMVQQYVGCTALKHANILYPHFTHLESLAKWICVG